MRMNYRRFFMNRNSKTSTPDIETMKVSVISDSHLNAIAADDESYPNLEGPPMFFYTARKKLADYVDFINDQKPDVSLHLGDVITGNGDGYVDSFSMFNSIWNTIDSEIKTSISAGNHDYPWLGDRSLSHEIVAQSLGYGDNPMVAGSKMNESFTVTKGNVGVKFINFETNIYTNGVFNSVGGYISTEMIDWIVGEVNNSQDNIIMLYCHKAKGYLEEQSRIALETALSQALTNKPQIKLYWLYGHSHVWQITEMTTDIGDIPMYNISAIVDNIASEFYTFNISEDGIESIDIHWASW